MKSPKELNTLKEEVETVSRKLHELTDEELAQISGGGSTVRVRGEDIARIFPSEVTAELAGKVPGVTITPSQDQPGSDLVINVR